MCFPSGSSFKPLIFAAAVWLSGAVLGQSLSIVKLGEDIFQIEASAPADNPHTLQASVNLHLWINILEEVTALQTHSLTNTGKYRFFRLRPSEAVPPTRVLLLGDSLTEDGSGWGTGMPDYLKETATLVNYGRSGASTKLFLQSAEKDNMLLIKPDYVLINYGLMDTASHRPAGFTTLEEFQRNLTTIVEMVRGFGGVPILITVQAPRWRDSNGNIVIKSWLLPNQEWVQRNEVIKRVSTDLNTSFIDFDRLTTDLYNDLGPSGVRFMNSSDDDSMHFSPLGTKYAARLIANALPGDLGPYLTGIFDPPPAP